MVVGIGSSNAISTSKIVKITAIRKKHDENGCRAEFFRSNPHSNGDLFSWSLFTFLEISVVTIMMAADSRMDSVAVVIIRKLASLPQNLQIPWSKIFESITYRTHTGTS
jgi:hypothetical protein